MNDKLEQQQLERDYYYDEVSNSWAYSDSYDYIDINELIYGGDNNNVF